MPRWIQVGEVSIGRGEKGGSTQRITVTLPGALAEELVRESIDRSTTVSAVVRAAVTSYFAAKEEEPLPDFVGMAEHPDDSLSDRVDELIADDPTGEPPARS